MYEKQIFSPIFFIFCVSAFAAQSETELYYSNSGGGFVLSDAAIWRVGSFDGPQFSGSLTETEDNVNSLNFSAAGSGNEWYVCTLNDSISVAGINADISCAGGGNSYVIDVSAGKTLDVSGDFSVVANYDSVDRVTDLKIRDGSSVNMGGGGGGVFLSCRRPENFGRQFPAAHFGCEKFYRRRSRRRGKF